MKATEANLLDLMGVAKMQFVIPVYQRVYSWSVKECEVLWDDVMRAGRDGVSHFARAPDRWTTAHDDVLIDDCRLS